MPRINEPGLSATQANIDELTARIKRDTGGQVTTHNYVINVNLTGVAIQGHDRSGGRRQTIAIIRQHIHEALGS